MYLLMYTFSQCVYPRWNGSNSFFTAEVSLNHVKISKMGIKLLGISADPTAAGKNCHHPTRTFVD